MSASAMKDMETQALVAEVIDEMGIIGPETKVIGDITTKGHITVMGSVQGNIDAKGNVIISGKIDGDIKCDNFFVESGKLETNITATGLVLIKDDVALKGTVACKDITITGTVIGDIVATGKVGLSSTAVVKGSIKAAEMGMELGAKFEGSLTIS